MNLRNVALIIFFDDKKRILLQNRDGISKFGEVWGYFGGRIEKGEQAEDALIRETKEELSYDLKTWSYLGLFNTKMKELTVNKFVFIAPLKNVSVLKQKEGKSMKFFTIPEALQLKMVPGDHEVIKELQNVL